VYIFAINGLTVLPHMCGSLNRLGEPIQGQGFRKPRVGSHYWRWRFQTEIRRIHRHDPQARFVLIGYSIGGGVVRSMARALEADGIPIALVLYVDAHSVVNDLHERPANVCRVVNILSTSVCLRGRVLAGAAENYQVPGTWHLGVPRHDATLGLLARELARVAATAP
jgi:hypothetical protein